MTKTELILLIVSIVQFFFFLLLGALLYRRIDGRTSKLETDANETDEIVGQLDQAIDELIEDQEGLEKAVGEMIVTSRMAYEKYASLEEALQVPLREKKPSSN